MLTFTAAIKDGTIGCTITSAEPLAAPVFCFSLMAAPAVVSGGTLLSRTAGFAEVALPDLAAGVPHEVVIAHENPSFLPRNRAWLPLGAYLKIGGQCIELPRLPAGVTPADPRPAAPWEGMRLVPQPERWLPAGGTLALGTLRCGHPVLGDADALAQRLGFGPLLGSGPEAVVLMDNAITAEGYRLKLMQNGVEITAADEAGIFNAAMTLLQLRQTHGGAIPCGTIEDAPRFSWRGQHLDSARHFFAAPTILRLLDMMALLKLNRFHWHLADDEAFRLDLPDLPGLHATHFRGEGELVPGVFGGGIRAGGCYSDADIAAIRVRAAANRIEIMPEIEVPAHSFALGLAFPATRERGDNGGEVSVQGYGRNVLSPARPEAWALWEALCDGVAARFPGAILHLGGDELPPGAWSGAPEVRALMERENLADADEVQGWLSARLAARLAKKGIRAAAWEESARCGPKGIAHDALIFSWTGQGPGIAAARAGHDVVMCPAQHTYFDIAHSPDPEDWGATWAGITPLEKVVDWQVVPEAMADIAERVVGVEGCFWGEFTTRDVEMEAMLAPRLLGLACKAWEAEGRTDGAALRSLAEHWRPLWPVIGWSFHAGA